MTHEEEARLLLYSAYPERAIREALRKRDELYNAAWGECERWRKEAGYQRWITGNGEWAYMHPNKNDEYLIHEADAHDTLRREAGRRRHEGICKQRDRLGCRQRH